MGASVRAAVASARNAHLVPMAIDRFGDADLQEMCTSIRLDSVSSGAADAAARMPDAPWFYTGPLENHPELVAHLSRERPLLGNGAEVIRQVRDPFRVAQLLRKEGLPVPATRASEPPAAHDDFGWLCKPIRSAGGVGISRWKGNGTVPSVGRPSYWQQFIPGSSVSGVFVAAGGQAQLLGVTQQLTGCSWCGCQRWCYCGSVGPVHLSEQEKRDLLAVANLLVSSFSMQGLFGVDAVLCDNRCWPVEVNPRYTASLEVLERCFGPLLPHHLAACCQKILLEPPRALTPGVYGKAVLFASREIGISEAVSDSLLRESQMPHPRLADIPPPGAKICVGQPVLTMFAEGGTPGVVKSALRQRADALRAELRC